MRRSLEHQDALRLLVGGPVVLVTTRWRDQTDVMPAIWTTPLSRTPPLLGVAVQPSRHTHEMVRFSEEFALNFPARDLMNHTHYFGVVSGRDVQKLDLAKLPTFKASKVSAPLIEGCLAWVECGLEDALRIGDHTLFVGRVLAVQAEPQAFDETWLVGEPDYRPLHYLGIDRYAVLGERFQAELRTGEEGTIELAETAAERERREEEEARERERRQREGEE
ncbi:MAG TPA: flavin reductase family protein [Dehalococcoidia bacterium]|nr:flavin reductase family protein [Dehalococcoidia bacterium]